MWEVPRHPSARGQVYPATLLHVLSQELHRSHVCPGSAAAERQTCFLGAVRGAKGSSGAVASCKTCPGRRVRTENLRICSDDGHARFHGECTCAAARRLCAIPAAMLLSLMAHKAPAVAGQPHVLQHLHVHAGQPQQTSSRLGRCICKPILYILLAACA